MFYSKLYLISIQVLLVVLLQHQKCLVKGEDTIVNNNDQFQVPIIKSGLYYGNTNGWNYYPTGYYPGPYPGQGQIGGIPGSVPGVGTGVICGGVPEVICSDNCFNQGYQSYYCQPNICYCFTPSPGSTSLG